MPSDDSSAAGVGGSLLGRYRIVDEIGVGGMATVHLARADGPGGFQKWVAIKRIHAHLAEDDSFTRMFLDEARIAARISHQNVAQVFDLGQQGHNYWLAMEYLHGEPLREVVRAHEDRGVALPSPLVAARIAADAADGLHAAHELRGADGALLNLVHRDVTPHNLFITYTGSVKVVDFGIAKVADRLASTRSGTLKGKLAYMSPEQVSGKTIDRRTDIFALGVVLWELTTGRRLFRADSDLKTLERVQACRVPPPSSLIEGYPPHLESVVLKALERDPQRRYQTARELSRALNEFVVRSGSIVGADEVGEYIRTALADRFEKREEHLRWAAEFTSTNDVVADELSVSDVSIPVTEGTGAMGPGGRVGTATHREGRPSSPAGQTLGPRSGSLLESSNRPTDPPPAGAAPSQAPAMPSAAALRGSPLSRTARLDAGVFGGAPSAASSHPPPSAGSAGGASDAPWGVPPALPAPSSATPSDLMLAAGEGPPSGDHTPAERMPFDDDDENVATIIANPDVINSSEYETTTGSHPSEPAAPVRYGENDDDDEVPTQLLPDSGDEAPAASPPVQRSARAPAPAPSVTPPPAAAARHVAALHAAAMARQRAAVVSHAPPPPPPPRTLIMVLAIAVTVLTLGVVTLVAVLVVGLPAQRAPAAAAPSAPPPSVVQVAPAPSPTQAPAAALAAAAPPTAVVVGPTATAAPGPDSVPAAAPRPVAAADSPPSTTGGGTGYLTLSCNPVCDVVRVGGQVLGKSPIIHRALPEGTHTVTLSREGARTRTIKVSIADGQTTTRQVAMTD